MERNELNFDSSDMPTLFKIPTNIIKLRKGYGKGESKGEKLEVSVMKG